jgi:hypothetical protein
MKTNSFLRLLVFGLALAAPGVRSAPEPLSDGLGSHTRQVTTRSVDAQKYFDRG